MSRSYRDYLDERGIARGPWVTFEDRASCDSGRLPEGGDGEATAPCEASQSGPKGIAKTTPNLLYFKGKNHV